MRESNILSILNAFNTLTEEIFNSYKEYYSINLRENELDDLFSFCNYLNSHTRNIELFDNYFIGYSIPQIGKEFDLLRFGEKVVVNIELKRESNLSAIKDQLIRNNYYLNFLGKKNYLFTYESSSKKLYALNSNNKVEQVNIKELIDKLASQNAVSLKNIDNCFTPSNYLVSPFNTTREFLNNNYFLTVQQEEIKNKILNELRIPSFSIVAIKGKAGTGKTLLTFDITKELTISNTIIVIHCGILNNGHLTLRDDYGWKIIPARDLYNIDYSEYDLVVVDEAQRIRETQLNHLIKNVKQHELNCIFSYDAEQTLKGEEIRANIGLEIEKITTLDCRELTAKIRTNKEVSRFIKCLFNSNEAIHRMDYSKVELKYFDCYETAKNYITKSRLNNWKVINYTPSKHHNFPYQKFKIDDENDNAHKVIGQEFDNIIAVINQYFFYNNDKLSTRNYKNKPYYHPTKMLYQIVSRTRKRLKIVIVKNPGILKRCLDILSKSSCK